MKKLLSCIIAAVLIFNSSPSVFAEKTETEIICTYDDTAKTAEITSINTNGQTIVVLPEKVIKGGVEYTVNGLSRRLFYGNTTVKTAVLPRTVTKMGDRMFAGCYNLEKVTLPENVQKLDTYTFSDCTMLKNLVIPTGCRYMTYNALKNCSRLENLVIESPDFSITDENNYSYGKFSDFLPDYDITNDIPEIKGNNAAAADDKDRNIRLGVYVKGFTDIYVPSGDVAAVFTSRGVPEGKVCVGDEYGLKTNLSDGVFTFDGKVSKDGSFAAITGFADGKKPVREITLEIPETVTADGVTYTVNAIADEAFNYDDVFSAGNKITGLSIPKTVEVIGRTAFHNCYINKLTIPGNVRVIMDSAFKSASITELKAENGLKAIGSQAFYHTKISNLVLPKSIEHLNLLAFQSCSSLKRLVIDSDSPEITNALGGVNSSLTVYVKNADVSQKLSATGFASSKISVLGKYTVVLNPAYGTQDFAVLTGDSNTFELPLYTRKMFTNKGWTDGKSVFSPGESVTVADNCVQYDAVWEFNDDNSKINQIIINENYSNTEYAEKIVSAERRDIVNSTENVKVNIDDTRVFKNTDRRIFGVTTCSEIQAALLVDSNNGELTEAAVSGMENLPNYSLFRGDTDPFTGLFEDIGDYRDTETAPSFIKRLKRGMNACVTAYTKINPNGEFIFILPVYTSVKSMAMTPEECLNMHRFFTADSDDEWGALRESLGFDKIKIAAYEFGNETYYNCRDLKKTDDYVSFADEESKRYADECRRYYDYLSPYTGDTEYSASLVSSTNYWQNEWNRSVIKYTNDMTKGLYSLHTYYGFYDMGRKDIDAICDRITQIYREEIGYNSDIRFAHTEHAVWGTYLTRNSFASGLAELSLLNAVINRSDTWCANYHTFTSNSINMWNIVNEFDGEIIQSGVSSAFGFMESNIGSRMYPVTYSSAYSRNAEYDICETRNSPNGRISVTASSDTDDILILIIANGYTDDTKNYSAVNLDFNFKNASYTLLEEKTLTAPNPYSTPVSAKTKNIVEEKTIAHGGEKFTNYTIAPNSAAVLVLKASQPLGKEIKEETRRTPQPDAEYIDLTKSAKSDGDKYVFEYPSKIDYISYTGSNPDFRLRARNIDGYWEVLADITDTSDGSRMYNDFTESYFDAIEITGADIGDVSVLGADNGIDGCVEREYDFNSDTVGINYGANTEFAGGKWVSGNNNTFGFGIGAPYDPSKPNDLVNRDTVYLDGSYLTLNNLNAEANSPDEYGAVYCNEKLDSGIGKISFDVARTDASVRYGVRFLASEDLNSYYQLKINYWQDVENGIQWTLSRITNGTETALTNGAFSIYQASRVHHFDLFYDNNEIYWNAYDMSNGGKKIELLCGKYKRADSSDVTFGSYKFGFFADSIFSSSAYSKYGVHIDSVKVKNFKNSTSPSIDDTIFTYTVNGSDVTITGIKDEYKETVQDLVIPKKLGSFRVTAIDDSAFAGNLTVKTVKIPDGITAIGKYAFKGCKNIVRANVPSTVMTWGEKSFEGCGSLRRLDIANGVKDISNALYGCDMLTALVIPESVKNLSCYAINLQRLRTVIFEGSTINLKDTSLFKNISGVSLGGKLSGNIRFYCLNDSMLNCLKNSDYGIDNLKIRTDSVTGEEQRIVTEKINGSAAVSYMQRATEVTGGNNHYKEIFVYAVRDINAKAILAVYNGDSLEKTVIVPIELGGGEYGFVDITAEKLDIGERRKGIKLILIDSFKSIMPLSTAFESVPW